MGLSVLLPVLLSVILTLIIVLKIRDYDKKSSDFSKACKKIKNYALETRKELDKICNERIESISFQCGELDISLVKGEGLIEKLSNSLDSFENELDSLKKAKNEINEYSGKLEAMGEQIIHLEGILSDVYASEEYLKTTSSELEEFQKNVASAKCQLESLNNRLDYLESTYQKQNETSLNKIKQEITQNFESESQNILDNLNKYKNSLNESYVEIEARLQEEKKRLAEDLVHIIEKSDETYSSFEARINEFSTKLSQSLNLLYEEHQDKLTSFEKSFEEIENRIVSIIQSEGAKKLQDLNTCFNSSWESTKERLRQHEDNVIESIDKHYATGRVDVQKMLQELRSLETRVSERMLELSDLDSKVQLKSDRFDLYLEKLTKDKLETFHNGLKEIEKDMEMMETSIFSSLREKYEKFDSRVVEELNKLGLRIGEKVEQKMREFSGMENKVSELKEAIIFIENDINETTNKLNEMSLDLKNSLYEKIDAVSSEVDARIKNMNASYEDDRKTIMKTMENSLDALTSESREKVYKIRNQLQELYSGVKSRLNNTENEIVRKTETIKRKIDQKIELIDEQIKQKEDKANSLILEKLSVYFRNADEKSKEFEDNLQIFNNELFMLKEGARKKCEDLTSWLAETVNVFAGENDIVAKKYREEMKILEADNLNLREKMLSENTQYIQSLSEQFKQIEDKLPLLNEEVRLNFEHISNLKEEQLLNMQKEINAEVFLIKQKMSVQSAEMDEKLIQKMRDVNEVIGVIQTLISQYDAKLNDFEQDKVRAFEKLENEVNELRTSYKEKGDELIKSSEKRVQTINESIHLLKEKADSINEDLSLTVDNKILRSKNDFERIYKGIEESGKKSLEDLINAKSNYMEELENRIAILSDKSKSSLVKILKIAQRNINEVRDNAGKDISERCRELEDGVIASLSCYREELNSVSRSLEELGNQVGPEVLSRIRESENALENRLNEMGKQCDEFLRDIESNFSEKRSEELAEYSNSIKVLKNEMAEAGELLRVRIEDELSEASRNASVEFSREIEKKLCGYEAELSSRYEELTDKFHKELIGYRVKLENLEAESREKLGEVNKYYDEESSRRYVQFANKLSDYSSRFADLEERLTVMQSTLSREMTEQNVRLSNYEDVISGKYEKLSAELSQSFENLSNDLSKDIANFESNLSLQNDIFEDLKVGYLSLSKDLADSSESLKNYRDEMSAVSENLKSEYSQKFATYSGEVEERLENIHEEISEKVESGVLDVISEFNEKINAKVEELHKERELVDSKVWESLCSYEEKLKVFAEEAAQSERVYEMRLDEFAQKLLSQQASLEEVSSEQLESLRGKYNQLSAEISAYQVEMYSEIDERTRRGLSELEKGLAERLSQLSQKEKECSELLKEESRTYTNLFENVYSQTLSEQKAFEKKIRESLEEVEKSFGAIKQAGESEAGKVLCEYNRLYGLASEIEKELESKKELSKNSLAESFSLYESRLSARYSDLELQMQMLEKCFGESVKAQTQVALSELNDGRKTLSAIRSELEELKHIGESKKAELETRYEEIESSLLAVKSQHENRLHDLVTTAGETARAELSKQLEMLSEKYESGRREAERLYGELSSEVLASGVMLSGLKEDLEALREESSLSYGEMLSKLNAELELLRENVESETVALGASNRREYEKLCREHNEELKSLRALTNVSVKELRNEVEEKLSSSLKEVMSVTEEIKELRRGYAESLSNQNVAREDYLDSLKELRNEHEAENARVLSKFADFENKLSELNLNYSRNLEISVFGAKRELEKILAYGSESLSDRIESANKELSEVLTSNKSDYDLIMTLYRELEAELRNSFVAGEESRNDLSLQKLEELRNDFENLMSASESKLNTVEKYYSDELSRFVEERRVQLCELSERFDMLSRSFVEKDENFAQKYNVLKEDLSCYREELNSVSRSLEELGNQVGPEVLSRIRESENALENRLNEMGKQCDEFLRDIESNFSEKRSEELAEYSNSIKVLKNEMAEAGELLRVRIEDELSEASRNASVEFSREIEKKLCGYEAELSSRYEELTDKFHKELICYRVKLENLEAESRERLGEVNKYYDEESSRRYVQFANKLSDYSSRFADLEERLTVMQSTLSREMTEQNVRLSNYEDVISGKYEKLSAELSQSFENLSNDLSKDIANFESNLSLQNEIFEDLKVGYLSLSEDLAQSSESLKNYRDEMSAVSENLKSEYSQKFATYSGEVEGRLENIHEEMSAVSENLKSEYSQKFATYSGEVEGRLENIHDEMSAVSENLKSEYSQKFATYSGEVEERLENIHEEISEKVESGVLDVISDFNEKINAKVEELHKERELVDSKVWESLCGYEEKLKVFAEEAAQSERVYEMRLDEFAQKLLSQQASLEEVSSEQLESLRGKYNQLSAEISAYQVEMYSEIDERTRRGLSELEKGLAERLSQLSQKEKECSELLKDESRTYTNLFENVYSKTLNEQKSFEKKIRESLEEVEKSFGAIKQAGESEAGKVLCEYNRLYGLASELEKELEAKKELSKNSLAESFSLYESRLSARYSDLELQMQMLEKCFGESVKAQTQVALSELNDGRKTLSAIRSELEELKHIGESKKAELETRYEEIESSLLAVKSQHENRLHDLVTTAGETARAELSKQLEMLSEKYESGRREAERLYGELSSEVLASGVMLSGLKEDLEALREESGLSYGEMLSKLNAELELLRENVESETVALGASNRREYEKLCREHNEELKSLRALTNVSVKELRNEVEEKLSSSLKEVMSVTEEIKELRRGYAESLLNQNVAREDYLDSLKELRNEHEAENARVLSKFADFENKLSELNLNYSRNLEISVFGAKRELEKILAYGSESLSDRIESANKELSEVLTSNKSDYDLIMTLYRELEAELRNSFVAGEESRNDLSLQKLEELRNDFENLMFASESKLNTVEKYYSDELSRFVEERRVQLCELSERFDQLSRSFVEKDENFAQKYNVLKEDLSCYREELNSVSRSLEELGNQVGPEVLSRIRESENALENRLNEMGKQCDEFLRDIESNFSEKRSEELAEYSNSIKVLKNEMAEAGELLRVRIEDELSEASRNASVEFSREIEKKLCGYEAELSSRYEELTDKFHKELIGYRVKLENLEAESREKLGEVSKYYDEESSRRYVQFANKLSDYSSRFAELEERLTVMQSTLSREMTEQNVRLSNYEDVISGKYEKLSAELSQSFENLSNDLSKDIANFESNLSLQNDIFEDLKVGYLSLSEDLAQSSESLKNYRDEISAVSENLKSEYSQKFASYSGEVEERLENIHEEISEKVESGVLDVISDFNEKINAKVEELHKERELVDSKVWESLCSYEEKLKVFAEEAAQSERVYEMRLDEFAQKLLSQQASLEEVSSEQLESLRGKYNQLSAEISAYQVEMYSEIDERTRRGLSELENGLSERLSQLSQKEKECSDLLKEESRTYTNLFENVYSQTLAEQKAFEKKIRESLEEVEKSFGAIKQAGESEAGKVLCEYNRLYGLASEIEKELESKKELSKNSLAESFSLYESRLSARYSDLELQMQMLEKCFGESVKAQTQVALSELNDGRKTLSAIRSELEELKHIGESKKAELETRYEEIESSLLAVKSQHENRLHDLVTTAGEAARAELSKQLEMLSEKYESGRREAERLYGELSSEVLASGVMLSGLKEDLEALREESGLSYGEMLSKLNAELELLRENVESETVALGASNRREYEKLCREHNEELKSLRALTNVSVKELRNEVEEKLSSSLKEVMSVTEEIKELRRGYAESLLNQNVAREDYLDSLKELRNEHEAENARVLSKFADFENKLSELNLNYSRNLEISVFGAKRELEKILAYGSESLSDRIESANKELSEVLTSNKSDYDLIMTLYRELEAELRNSFVAGEESRNDLSLQKLEELRNDFENLMFASESKLNTVEKYYSDELSRFVEERRVQLCELSERFDQLSRSFVEKDESFAQKYNVLKEDLSCYREELNSVSRSLEELGNQVGPEVLSRIRESENALENRLNEMGKQCDEFLRDIESNFSEKRSEELAEYSNSIKVLKNEMAEAGELLRVRIEDELSEASRNASVEFSREIEKKLCGYEAELSSRYEELTDKFHKELICYRVKLENLEAESRERLGEVNKYYDEESSRRYVQFANKLSDYSSRFADLEERLTVMQSTLSREMTEQNVRLSNYEDVISGKYEKLSAELSQSFENLSNDLSKDIANFESNLSLQNEIFEDLKVGYLSLSEDLAQSSESLKNYRDEMSAVSENLKSEYSQKFATYSGEVEGRLENIHEEMSAVSENLKSEYSQKFATYSGEVEGRLENIHDEMSAVSENLKSEYSQKFATYSGEVEERLENIHEEISEKVESGVLDVISDFNEKINAKVEELHKERELVDSKVWESLCGYEEKLKVFAEEAAQSERVYEMRLDEFAQKLLSQQASLEEVSSEQLESLRGKYNQLSAEISAYQVEMYSEIDERTRRGLSELEKGLAERLSQLSQKEKECSELLKDESRTYTNLFENVYSKTLNEQKSFEKKIRESLEEVEKSFGAIKQAGESEAGKVLCEYNRLYGLASELEKELEAKKELSKNSLAESFSLYESRLSARYSDLELQMQMLEKCFGESVKAQTQVALSELNDGRKTLSAIRSELEELKHIGESKKAELETRYEEIESSLLAVKSQHENRLHDLVTTAGETARAELSKQLEMLSEKYESGRREAERLYGELSSEVLASGVMLSGLKEDLEALREESSLSYGEMLSKLNAELELLRENVESETVALGASNRREYEKLCREHNEELKSLRALTNVSVKELRNEVEEKLSSSLKEVMSVTEEIKELRRGYAESLSNQNVAREDYLDSLKELRNEHEAENARVLSKFADFENKLSELNLNYSRNLEISVFGAKRELEKILAYGSESLSDRIESANKELSEVLTSNKSDYDLIMTLYRELEAELRNSFVAGEESRNDLSLQKLEELRNDFENLMSASESKLNTVEKYYSDELSRFVEERRVQLCELSERFDMLSRSFVEKDENFAQKYNVLKEDLSCYREELNSVSRSLEELGNQVGPEVLSRIRESENALENRLNEMGKQCDEFLRDIESNFSEKRSEELAEYSNSIKVLKNEMAEAGELLRVRIEDELSEASRNASVEFSREIEKKLCGYEAELSSRYEELTDKFHKELICYRVKLENLEAESRERLGEVNKYYDEESSRRYVQFANKLSDYSSRFADLEERLTVMQSTLSREMTEQNVRLSNYEDVISGKYEKLSAELSQSFENLSNDLSKDIANFESNLSLQNEIFEDLKVGYLSLSEDLAQSSESLKNYRDEMSAVSENLKSEYSQKFATYSGEVEGRLENIHEEMSAVSENLKSEYSQKFATYSGEVEGRLENIHDEMSAVSENLKSEYSQKFATYSGEVEERLENIHEEISEKVESGVLDVISEFRENIFARSQEAVSQITDLVKQRIDEIQRAEEDCEKELRIRIDSYGEEIKNMQLHCSELEMQYENAVRDGLRQTDSVIENKLTDLRSYIAQEKTSISNFYQEQLDNSSTKLTDLANTAKECQNSYEDLVVKMAQLENDITGKVNIYLEQVVARLDAPVAEAKYELANILTKVDGLKDVIETKTRLMADEILKELKDKTEDIFEAAEERSVEWENKLNQLFERVESHLTDCKMSVRTQAERLQKLEASYQAQLARKLGETDEVLENELNGLRKAFLSASEKLSKEISNLHREYEERERDLFLSAKDSVKEMENKIIGLDFRIETIGSEIGGKLEKQFVSVQTKMDDFIVRQEKLYQTKVEELQVQFKSELESTQLMCDSKLAEMQTDVDNKTQDIYLKLNKIYDNFSVDAMKFDNENRERYRELLEKMEAATEKVDTLKEELSVGMEERIKREFQVADELFVGKTQEMRENILRMEAENKNQLDDYYRELMRVQDALDVIENDYAVMTQNKLAVLDNQVKEQLTEIKVALSDSVMLINDKMTELSDKMKSVETSYTEKAEFMLFNQEQKWKEIEDKYSDFDEHVEAVYRRLPNAAKEMDEVIAKGKVKLEEVVYFQIEEQKRHFQEIEMQLEAKTTLLNKKMQEMQRSIREVDSRFAAQYLERSGVLDERIASIEFEISKFERNIALVQKTGEMKDELEKEISILKDTVAEVKADKNKMEALGERMAELEMSANERYEKLHAESQSYEDLNARIKGLQAEIENVENKTQDLRDMRLATQQLDAKFIVLERQFGRLDSMIGKIETSEAIAKDYSQKLNEMRSNVSQLRQMMNVMESQWQEMEVKRKVYGEKMEHFESEADLILNSQSQINAVMTKFKQMDLLVEDLESRTGAVRHLQDWLIRAETRMENMKSDLLRVLPEEEKVVVPENNGSLGESIRELRRQGMNVEDIAKIVGTSREEVEFALELEDVLTSKR